MAAHHPANESTRSNRDADCCPTAEHALSEQELAADVRTLSAVGSDTRYEALRLIADRDEDICVCELEPALGVSQGAVSQALSRLYAAGLVTRRKDGRWRYYGATPRADRLLDVLDETRRLENE
ncbi:winged helix-turn-helix domain-containing protein [Natronosalvus rutilus]|uniref:Winged helix-turn-helix domain-containing protein n=1 Tax=Natronosalvus rutilus TaxID=2953753 RepID=A0A9E7SVD1_9EURY|nr:winged helix-turn-helix domain-containing protein [Natronosalvus rutilus]UTF54385.1 winged helix-turn-helix domain-containing protein [Natronosalvus rutilus]